MAHVEFKFRDFSGGKYRNTEPKLWPWYQMHLPFFAFPENRYLAVGKHKIKKSLAEW